MLVFDLLHFLFAALKILAGSICRDKKGKVLVLTAFGFFFSSPQKITNNTMQSMEIKAILVWYADCEVSHA